MTIHNAQAGKNLQKIVPTRLPGGELVRRMAAMKMTFISSAKRQLLAWHPEGIEETRPSFPKIGGEELDWKVVLESPAKFENDFTGLWELWLFVEELASTKGRNWRWVACWEVEWKGAFVCIVQLLDGASRDAALLRGVAGLPSLEKLHVRDTLTATCRDMLQAAEMIGSRRKLVTMLKNRLLVTMVKQAESRGRKRTRIERNGKKTLLLSGGINPNR
jgi:hypothetical protein